MVNIRKMESYDAPQVCAYGKAELRFRLSQDTGGFWSKTQLERWIASDDGVTLVAEENGELAGFALATLHRPTGKAELENLYVRPTYRKKHVGRELAEACLSQLKSKGATYCVSLMAPDNESILQLHDRLGFKREANMIWADRTL